ncbi:MAG: ribose-phosphate pyrophosphokinase [Gammaproteobacteria bacterium]|nr:ribose-phosphate pyrophosphokinase [Gammaproteobacteria bacterium]
MNNSAVRLFSGTSVPQLASRIASEGNFHTGCADINRFSDGEVSVTITDNVRGLEIFLIQSTCAPTNDYLMEFMIMVDALKRASAQRITAVIPYLGYSRQDRRAPMARVPISAKVVAEMLCLAGIDRLITVDLHADQVQGFYDVPVDNVYGSSVLIPHVIEQNYGDQMVVVSPDIGGVLRARAVAKRVGNAEIAIIDKRREQANESEVINVIGDIEGRVCIIVDDIVDTAGTLCNAAIALKERGATKVVSYITHPVLSGPAIERIDASELDSLVVTDTIPLRPDAQECEKIHQLSMAATLAETIRRVCERESVSALFV